MQHFLKKNIEVSETKQILLDEYKLIADWKNIYEVLHKQGKRRMISNIRTGKINFENTFQSEEYYISNLDIFLMIKKYKIPTIFISGSNLKETGANNPQKIISFLYNSKNVCIIHSPASSFNKPKKYSIIIKMNEIFFPIGKFPTDFQNMLPDTSHSFTFQDYYNRMVSIKYKIVASHKLRETITL